MIQRKSVTRLRGIRSARGGGGDRPAHRRTCAVSSPTVRTASEGQGPPCTDGFTTKSCVSRTVGGCPPTSVPVVCPMRAPAGKPPIAAPADDVRGKAPGRRRPSVAASASSSSDTGSVLTGPGRPGPCVTETRAPGLKRASTPEPSTRGARRCPGTPGWPLAQGTDSASPSPAGAGCLR